MFSRRSAGALALSLALAGDFASAREGAALAQLPWIQPGTRALDPEVSSVHIVRADEPLYQRPDVQSPRRGTAEEGAHLPLFQAVSGPGCQGRWLSVGPMAWVCEEVVTLSRSQPLAAGEPPPHLSDGLPHRYYFVGEDGSLGYRELRQAEQGYPDAELDPGFAVAVTTTARHEYSDLFGLTTHGLWVPMRDLRAARPLTFAGASIDGSDFVWVTADTARVYSAPGGHRLDVEYPRFTRLGIVERRDKGHRSWFATKDGHWLRDDDVTYRTKHEPPASVRPNERWIDIELERQVMTAYEGSTPVFSTLVSSGRGRDDAEDATPKGEHRVWVKLKSSDMDNLENEEAGHYYAMQSVPWVMYFKKGYGLHGAFWHRDFGHRRSHGCVNLTPLDAQWLFYWTSPRLPAGWTAVFPTRYERGTLVRVR